MRRLFIIRKDLNLTPGKMGAMVGHLAEAYWTNMLKKQLNDQNTMAFVNDEEIMFNFRMPRDIWNEYVNGIFTKTICEAKNLTDLKKVENYIWQINNDFSQDHLKIYLMEGRDWGYINDCCLTELKPENADGTTTIGVWFKPLEDDVAHRISKKYKLYGVFDKKTPEIKYYEVVENSYGGPYEQCRQQHGKYTTFEEAKKHFDYLIENTVKNNDVFSKNITELSDKHCEYNDGGHQWSYSIYITENIINDIRDKFIEPTV